MMMMGEDLFGPLTMFRENFGTQRTGTKVDSQKNHLLIEAVWGARAVVASSIACKKLRPVHETRGSALFAAH